jgi:hypothetical protein
MCEKYISVDRTAQFLSARRIERLQRMRLGHAVLPPVKLALSR